MRLTAGGNIARVNIDEIIAGRWEFVHPDGVVTDVITERTPGLGVAIVSALGLLVDVINELTTDAGVTIEGVSLEDKVLSLFGRPLTTDFVLRTRLSGDTFERFAITAAGNLVYGPGNATPALQLSRSGPGELTFDGAVRIIGNEGLDVHVIRERSPGFGVRVDDVLMIDGVVVIENATPTTKNIFATKVVGESEFRFLIDASGKLKWGPGNVAANAFLSWSSTGGLTVDKDLRILRRLATNGIAFVRRDVSLVVGDNHNIATIFDSFLTLTGAGGGSTITGFGAVPPGHVLYLLNTGAVVVTLSNEDVGSSAANRLTLPGGVDIALADNDGVTLIYDQTDSRWKRVG